MKKIRKEVNIMKKVLLFVYFQVEMRLLVMFPSDDSLGVTEFYRVSLFTCGPIKDNWWATRKKDAPDETEKETREDGDETRWLFLFCLVSFFFWEENRQPGGDERR